jgi:hypothetical protein
MTNLLIVLKYTYIFLDIEEIFILSNMNKLYKETINDDIIVKLLYKKEEYLFDKNYNNRIRFYKNLNSYCIDIYIESAHTWCEEFNTARCNAIKFNYSRCTHNYIDDPVTVFEIYDDCYIMQLKLLYNYLLSKYDDFKLLNQNDLTNYLCRIRNSNIISIPYNY